MNGKITKMIVVVTVLGLALSAPAAYAEGWGGKKQCDLGKDKRSEKFFKDLNLTAGQKAKLDAQREAKWKDRKAEREQIKVKIQELHAEIAKPGTTRADVQGLVDEISAAKGQMFAQQIDGVFAMKEVLTPEQFAKMEVQRKERMEKMKGKHGDRKGPPPEPDQE